MFKNGSNSTDLIYFGIQQMKSEQTQSNDGIQHIQIFSKDN
jgi:hypothetical protein